MKIAFIGQKGIPAVSGEAEKHVEELAVRMAKSGHEIFVYADKDFSPEIKNIYKGVKIICLSNTFFATFHALFQNYDVIHFQTASASLFLPLVKFLKRHTAIIATLHNQGEADRKLSWTEKIIRRRGEKNMCRLAHKTIAVNKVLRKKALSQYGTDGIYIPNGAQPLYNPQTHCLERWDLKDKRYILSVSQLSKNSGIHYLIEAFKKLEDTNKLPNNFKLVIASDGFSNESYVKKIKELSRNRDSIIFTGTQANSALAQLFSHAFLYLECRESGFPSSALLKAMSYGVAPLVSNILENKEITGKTGFLFRSKDVINLEEKLAYLLNKPSEVELAGRMAKTRVEKEFSWEAVVQKTLDVYKQSLYQKDYNFLIGLQEKRRIL